MNLEERNLEIVRLRVEEKMRCIDIAKRFGLKRGAVYHALRQHGLSLRSSTNGARSANALINKAALADMTPTAAYFAGAMCANCTLETTRLLIKKFHFDRGQYAALRDFLTKRHWHIDRFHVSLSGKMYPDLVRWGITGQNRRDRKPPRWLKGHVLEPFFWRGYVENRCCWFYRYKQEGNSYSIRRMFRFVNDRAFILGLDEFFFRNVGSHLGTARQLETAAMEVGFLKIKLLGKLLYASPEGPRIPEFVKVMSISATEEFSIREKDVDRT